ncbi:GIY-YIG nuclease family protein [Streptomyces sp. NPDC054861]
MTTYVYVIGEQGSPIVKIGTTNDLSLRLTALQTGNPKPIALLWSHKGDRELEGHLHATFAAHRMRGEWFDLGVHGDPAAAVQKAVEAASLGLLPRPRRATTPGTGRSSDSARQGLE